MRARILAVMIVALAAPAVRAQEALEYSTNAVVGFAGPQSRLSAWVYTDKYVYTAAQPITLRWTVKTNNDLYPYVVIAYRQNNQTGEKFYLPGGTDTLTDINGNAQGSFVPRQLTDVTKAVLADVTAPGETGMHTFVVQFRDYTGTRVLKAIYMKIGVVTGTQTLQGDVTTDRTLTNDTQWNLTGVVNVKNGAVLTVEPGTFIIGQPGSQPPSVLLVTQNGRLVANGTRSRPIVFTSSRPFGQRQRGDWGGILMLGKAPINVGANSGGQTNPAGTFFIEGLAADPEGDGLYGGTDPNHMCSSLQYVRIEFAGSILSPNNEVNSFTWGGCGKGTVANHLQATYGLDDSFEWFGGTMDAKYLIGGLSADDFVDFQLGYTGRIQYGLFFQTPDVKGNRGIEGDNSEYLATAEPWSNPTMFNLTFVGSGAVGFDEASSPGIFLRRGARASINNTVVTNFFSSAMELNGADAQAQAAAGNLRMNGVLMWNNGLGSNPPSPNTVAAQPTSGVSSNFAQGQVGTFNGKPAGQNFLAADPLLNKPFEFSDPDFRSRFGSPTFRAGAVQPPDDGFFDQSSIFLGGIGDDDWTEEWPNWLVETDIAP